MTIKSTASAAAGPANIDHKTVEGFGEEWAAYDQTAMTEDEWHGHFAGYFSVFPWHRLPDNAEGFDLGCGSGRWAAGVAPQVGTLHCVDPSDKALAVAKRRLADRGNVHFHCAGVDAIPLADASQDFGYSLGVLHHIPDATAAMAACVRKLKPGAPFLVYLYYAFDNRPAWFRAIWKVSDVLRSGISRLPFGLRKAVTTGIAVLAYWPLARLARMASKREIKTDNFPLNSYKDYSFYTMRTDALDRFGTRLEQRFTRREIQTMMENSGLTAIRFREDIPYWVACGYRQDPLTQHGRSTDP